MHLVGLQAADEMDRYALVGPERLLLHQLLNPVFPAGVHAGGDGLLHAVGVVHLRGSQERYFLRVTPGRDGGGVHSFPDLRDVFCNAHLTITFPLNISSFVRMTSSSGQRF